MHVSHINNQPKNFKIGECLLYNLVVAQSEGDKGWVSGGFLVQTPVADKSWKVCFWHLLSAAHRGPDELGTYSGMGPLPVGSWSRFQHPACDPARGKSRKKKKKECLPSETLDSCFAFRFSEYFKVYNLQEAGFLCFVFLCKSWIEAYVFTLSYLFRIEAFCYNYTSVIGRW